ncbi:MAG: hypothetical protein ABIL37_00555 [candidate division WOR-3 bacterium]
MFNSKDFDPLKEIMNAILVRRILNKLLTLKRPIKIEIKEVEAIGPNYIKYSRKIIRGLPTEIDIDLLKRYAIYLANNNEEIKKELGDV